MSITPVQGLISSALSQTNSLRNPVSVSPNSDITAVSDSSVDQSSTVSSTSLQTSNLQVAALSLAKLVSQLQTAQSGTQKIGAILQNLQQLAVQVTNAGDDSAAINRLQNQFNALYSQVNDIATQTSFSGSNLLNGTLSTQIEDDKNANASKSVIADLSTNGLFGNNQPDISTAANAQTSLAFIASALAVVNDASVNIEGANAQVSLAAASVETAQENTAAASSTLTESDLVSGTSSDLLSELLSKPLASANTQTAKLPANLIKLLAS